ncbi:MAG TPA: hypothetical protein VML75_19025 [Kofleriaceae bacterium]|nr:hypothetical protein [Kofleriaceae bacterium]
MRARSHRAWLGTTLTVALGAMYLGCAGSSKAVQPPPQSPDAAVVVPANPYQSEIVAMMSEIRGWRGELGLKLEPTDRVLGTVRSARDVCPVIEIVEECRDTCTLADHICENAENICRIADGELRGDQWAKDKCSSAKASCDEAAKECCNCQDKAGGGATEP